MRRDRDRAKNSWSNWSLESARSQLEALGPHASKFSISAFQHCSRFLLPVIAYCSIRNGGCSKHDPGYCLTDKSWLWPYILQFPHPYPSVIPHTTSHVISPSFPKSRELSSQIVGISRVAVLPAPRRLRPEYSVSTQGSGEFTSARVSLLVMIGPV